MLVVALFTIIYTLFITATPLPASNSPATVDCNSHITLCRRAPPKFEIPRRHLLTDQKQDTIDKMNEHYRTKATEAQKSAKLVVPLSRWNKHSAGRESMLINYHVGDNTDSPVIGEPGEIYRDKPMPKLHFVDVPNGHQEEMKAESAKRYRGLPQRTSDRVKSMKVSGDWSPNGRIRERTTLTFHSTASGSAGQIGDPTIMHRPLTLKIPNVPSSDRLAIDKSVREAHKKMVADGQHLARTSNYGTVHSNWHDSLPDTNGKTHKQVVVGLEEVLENEKKRNHVGNYAVRKDTSDYEPVGLHAGNPSSYTGTSYTGPLFLNSKVSGPSNHQEQHHTNIDCSSRHTLPFHSGSSHLNNQGSLQLDAGSPLTHTLPLNSGTSRLNSQGPSQFNDGSLSSQPGPPRPELFRLVAPQPLQIHTNSPPRHNEFLMPSPELWRPWNPLSQPSHETWQSLHPDLYTDQLWHADSPLPKSPPSSSKIQTHPNSPSPLFGAGSPEPSSRPVPSHLALVYPISPRQPLQPHTSRPLLHNNFYVPSPEVWRPWDPLSQPSHETWHSSHPDLYTDQLWHADSPLPKSPPSAGQIQAHPNSPSPLFGAGSPGPPSPVSSHLALVDPISPQQPLQPHISRLPLHNSFYVPSPEVWRPWDPLSQPSHETWQSLHPDLYTDQLWHADSPHPPSNSQILPHPDSPSSHPGSSHPGPTQSNSAVLPNHQRPQVGLPSNPGGSPHASDPDGELSPEIWNLLHQGEVYPYLWNPREHSS